MAQALEERFDGEVPTAIEDLVTIPGVGRKTGNVIRSVAFDLPGLPVDTHVGRLSRRLRLTSETDPVKVERDLDAMVAPEERGALVAAPDPPRATGVRRPSAPLRRLRARRPLPVGVQGLNRLLAGSEGAGIMPHFFGRRTLEVPGRGARCTESLASAVSSARRWAWRWPDPSSRGRSTTLQASPAAAAPTGYVKLSDGTIDRHQRAHADQLRGREEVPDDLRDVGLRRRLGERRHARQGLRARRAAEAPARRCPLPVDDSRQLTDVFNGEYVTVHASVRGTGCSSGEFDLFS